MKKSTKMFLLALLVGALLVAAILTFIALGLTHPVPWILVVATIATPLISNLSEGSEYVKWKEQYSVGIQAIDEEHKKLLYLVNQFLTASNYYTGKDFEKQALDELVDYTRYHFKHEEDMLAENGYPDLVAHQAEHRKMIAKVEQVLEDYETQGHVVLEDTANYLKEWLINHISGTDKAYSTFLHGKGIS
jgi:hemerythrin-like metal-binding protein